MYFWTVCFMLLQLVPTTSTASRTDKCAVPVDDHQSIFGHSTNHTPPIAEYWVDGFEQCVDICCNEETLCNVGLFIESAINDETNCRLYECQPINSCSFKEKKDVLVFIRTNILEDDSSTTTPLDADYFYSAYDTLSAQGKNDSYTEDLVNENIDGSNRKEYSSSLSYLETATIATTPFSSSDEFAALLALPQSTAAAEYTSDTTTTAVSPISEETDKNSMIMTSDSEEVDRNDILMTSFSEEHDRSDISMTSVREETDRNSIVMTAVSEETNEYDALVTPTQALVTSDTAVNSLSLEINSPQTATLDTSEQLYQAIHPSATLLIEHTSSNFRVLNSVEISDTELNTESLTLPPTLQSSTLQSISPTIFSVVLTTTEVLVVENISNLLDFEAAKTSAQNAVESTSVTDAGHDNNGLSMISETLQSTEILPTATKGDTPVSLDYVIHNLHNATGFRDASAGPQPPEGRTAIFISTLAIGCVFVLAIVGVLGFRAYEAYRKRHYSRLDYLINGMYS